MNDKSDLDEFLGDMKKLFGPSLENLFGLIWGIVLLPWQVCLWLREKPTEEGKVHETEEGDDARASQDVKSRTQFKAEEGETSWLRVAIVVLMAVLLLFWLVGWYPLRSQASVEQAGQYGDSFGYVNALFSSLALAAVIMAIFMQREDLREQGKDTEAQLKEMRESVKAQKEQAEASVAESFVNALATYNDIRKNKFAGSCHELMARLAVLHTVALAKKTLPRTAAIYSLDLAIQILREMKKLMEASNQFLRSCTDTSIDGVEEFQRVVTEVLRELPDYLHDASVLCERDVQMISRLRDLSLELEKAVTDDPAKAVELAAELDTMADGLVEELKGMERGVT